ncbi:hypothetical protein D3C72_1464130 [compost metagenome]
MLPRPKIQTAVSVSVRKGRRKRATRKMLSAFCERKPAALSLSIVASSTSAWRRLNFSTIWRTERLLLARRLVLPCVPSALRRVRSRARMRSRSVDTAFMRLLRSPRSM